MADQKTAKKWAEHRQDSYKCKKDQELAAAYLELWELAKAVTRSQMDEESRWPEMTALRKVLKD